MVTDVGTTNDELLFDDWGFPFDPTQGSITQPSRGVSYLIPGP